MLKKVYGSIKKIELTLKSETPPLLKQSNRLSNCETV